jgi:hypothetical protein
MEKLLLRGFDQHRKRCDGHNEKEQGGENITGRVLSSASAGCSTGWKVIQTHQISHARFVTVSYLPRILDHYRKNTDNHPVSARSFISKRLTIDHTVDIWMIRKDRHH